METQILAIGVVVLLFLLGIWVGRMLPRKPPAILPSVMIPGDPLPQPEELTLILQDARGRTCHEIHTTSLVKAPRVYQYAGRTFIYQSGSHGRFLYKVRSW